MHKNENLASIKSWFLVFCLFLVSVLLITPITLMDNLKPILTVLEKLFHEDSYISILLGTYFAPLMLLLFNVVIIPFFIDLIALVEDHKTKSARQVAIMKKNFGFMLINTIFLPLTGLLTIKSFIEYISDLNWKNFPTALSGNLVTNNYFFLRYII
jgi:hypothetical protein